MTGYQSKKAAARDKLAQPVKQPKIKSWVETHPRNRCATCACEHWQFCVEFRPTAYAQPAQEPVAYLCKSDKHDLFDFPTPDKACNNCFPVYTTPPKRPWVGLTKKEQLEIFRQLIINPVSEYKIFKAYEKALKEKNT